MMGWKRWVQSLDCRYGANVSKSVCKFAQRPEGLHGGVETYEVWNEPNIQHIETGELATFTSVTANVIKVAAPPARIWAGVVSGVGVDYVSEFLSAVKGLGGIG